MLPLSSGLKNKPNKKQNEVGSMIAVLITFLMLVCCMAYSLNLKMEVICSLKRLVDF
jgi:hypothetical protein